VLKVKAGEKPPATTDSKETTDVKGKDAGGAVSVTKVRPIEQYVNKTLLDKYIDAFWHMNCPDSASMREIE